VTHEGGLLGLFNPFALRCGLVSVAMLVLHGGVWLACKSEGALAARARAASAVAGIALIVLFAADGAAAGLLPGYAVQSFAGTEAASNPLAKVVVREAGELLDNYARYPWMMLTPALGLLGTAGALATTRRRRAVLSFTCSSL
jgi:cytochrome d ubiquinol oxidase subunit II